MTYKDDLTYRLYQIGIEPTEGLLRFIELEVIPLKSKLFELRVDNIQLKIEQFLENIKIGVSPIPNELMYGYCSNGSYELKDVDIKELSKFINDEKDT